MSFGGRCHKLDFLSQSCSQTSFCFVSAVIQQVTDLSHK
nr:MAG TPA: hypothetical protein [Caudoviricetes sp.]